MKARLIGVVVAVKDVLVSKELRPAELLILRAVALAVGAKLGIDVARFLGA